MCNMYIDGEYGGGTGWVFRGDAKLAHSAVWLGCVCGRTGLLFGGDAELARERDLAGMCFWKNGTFVLRGRGIGA